MTAGPESRPAGVVTGPLAGLRAIAVATGPLAAACGSWLAGHGAEVIAISPPAARHAACRSEGRRLITLDLADAQGVELLARLLRRSDLLIEPDPPAAAIDAAATGERASALIRLRCAAGAPADPAAVMTACAAVLLALHGRMRTGEGQILDLPAAGTPRPHGAGLDPPSRPDADNGRIFADLLGLADDELRTLRAGGVL
jgi:crotonobetainyl-CoA:carnitine CoA-transferase CaiB-like acyl-CoA transferase